MENYVHDYESLMTHKMALCVTKGELPANYVHGNAKYSLGLADASHADPGSCLKNFLILLNLSKKKKKRH